MPQEVGLKKLFLIQPSLKKSEIEQKTPNPEREKLECLGVLGDAE